MPWTDEQLEQWVAELAAIDFTTPTHLPCPVPQDTLDRDDWSRGVPAVPSTGKEFFASLRQRFVAADMIGIGSRINDVANGFG